MLLGNTSWRIKGIEAGKVRVEDAHGAPPNIPFWRGEAPSRTSELSAEVARLRADIDRLTNENSSPLPPYASPVQWLVEDSALVRIGARRASGLLWVGRPWLGV